MNRGGTESVIMNYYRNIDRNHIQFDFLLTETKKCDFEDEILSLGGKIYRVPLLTIKNPFSYYKAVKQFLHEHKEYKIVHSHTSSKSAIPLWIAKKAGVPVRICHSHNTQSEKGINGIIRNILKIPLKFVATHWAACGDNAAIWLYGEKSLKDGKVHIIKNVIESSYYDFNLESRNKYREKLNIDENTLVVGLTARFNHQKNHLFALDILKELINRGIDVKFLLIGTGILKEEIIKKANSLSILDRIIFTGVVSNVNDYLQAMDIFLMPSFHEGLGMACVEAQIASLPCIVSTGVPKEADITGLVSFLPLSCDIKLWADEILNKRNTSRVSQLDKIKKAGYDAKTSAVNLQNFYLNVYPK